MAAVTKTVALPAWATAPGGDGNLVLRDTTAQMELDAAREAAANGNTQLSLLHALAKRHLVSWDGKKASWEDGQIDELWESIGNRGRALIMTAINAAFYSDDTEELKAFLARLAAT